ncbi:hypothetical protein SB2_11975 [Methylobacterium radiotolerans]|nr:hypothetical protein SB3_11170 [Methylobacterium radiotolerans]KTS48008.1 hypothetical protein SB2_11975 [Methylobacterium radiotolerans]
MAEKIDVRQSWIAISEEGRVVAAAPADGPRTIVNEAFREWSANPGITSFFRVPDEVVRRFFRKPWPGRDEALRSLEDPHA